MSDKPKVKGLIERKLEDPEYRKRHDERYAAFKLEAQILTALEEKNWTYDQLAKATGTSKSNVSRDLKAGGIWAASFFRIHRIAEALGMKLVSVLIPKESEQYILPKIENIVRTSMNSGFEEGKLIEPNTLTTNLTQGSTPNSSIGIFNSNFQNAYFQNLYSPAVGG